jgi:hypothetical protein
MAGQPNAILAISSTDRYTANFGNASQPYSNTLEALYFATPPYSNDFQITSPGALMNGYIDKIIISQIQLQYNLPTVMPNINDEFVIFYESAVGSSSFILTTFAIPFGFYTPDELAAMLQIQLGSYVDSNFTVSYQQNTPSLGIVPGFVFLSNTGRRFYFPAPSDYTPTPSELTNTLKLYRLMGINLINSFPETEHTSSTPPEFLYTPYIDIYSDALTNYQKLKDTDSSTSRRKGLIARIYLSGVGNPQITSNAFVNQDDLTIVPSTALGCNPFVLTYDLNTPKIINWSPDTAVNSLDFQMRDCYGDLLFNYNPSTSPGQAADVFNTEFQMTLLCVERD